MRTDSLGKAGGANTRAHESKYVRGAPPWQDNRHQQVGMEPTKVTLTPPVDVTIQLAIAPPNYTLQTKAHNLGLLKWG